MNSMLKLCFLLLTTCVSYFAPSKRVSQQGGFERQFSRLLYQTRVFLCPRCRCVTVVKGKVTNLFAIRTLRCSNPLGKPIGMSEVYRGASTTTDRNNSCSTCRHAPSTNVSFSKWKTEKNS